MVSETVLSNRLVTTATLLLALAAVSAPQARAGGTNAPPYRPPASGFVPLPPSLPRLPMMPMMPVRVPGPPPHGRPAWPAAPFSAPPMWPTAVVPTMGASSRAEAPTVEVSRQGAAALDSELATEARGLVQDFAKRLKGALETAIKDGGPTAAVEVCNEEAPQIADALSTETGWAVARTSLKHRNPANAPDDWERGVLQAFETRQADGEEAKGMTFTANVSEADGRQFRFMQAIPTAQVCLVCHGSAVPDDVASAIDELYPGDLARGYEAGEIRGAFSLVKPL